MGPCPASRVIPHTMRRVAKASTSSSRSGMSRRGRPPKYGQPSRVVAVTLPTETIAALRAIHADLGWAIVTLAEQTQRAKSPTVLQRNAELVEIGHDRALIVVDPATVRALAGVRIVPISDHQAFLALESGRGMADLELAVVDRLERQSRLSARERTALSGMLAQLRKWRRNSRLSFEMRSIILVTRKPG